MRTAPSLLLTAALTATAVGALPAAATATPARKPAKAHDFNGDGHTDLVINAPQSTRRSGPGLVAIIYGKTKSKQLITRNSPGVSAVADHGDYFGDYTASADFDRDGYADLAITGRNEDGTTIVYGSKKGLSKRVAFLKAPRPAETGMLEPSALAVGDFDRDGYADLVTTVQNQYWIFTKVNKGRKQLSKPTGEITDQNGDKPPSITPMAADFTGDGRDDLLLGAGSRFTRLLKNSPTGFTDPVAVPGTRYHYEPMATGDLNGDGRDDLVIGGGNQISILMGRSSGLAKPRIITRRDGSLPAGSWTGLGGSVAIGDVNRDGKDDLAIGALYGGANRSGRVLLLYGRKGGPSTKGAQTFTQNKALKAAPERGDRFGGAVRILDLTGDRRPELVIGSPGENKTVGRLYILPNKNKRITTKGAVQYGPKHFKLGGTYFAYALHP